MSVEELIYRGLIFLSIYGLCGAIVGGLYMSKQSVEPNVRAMFIHECIIIWPQVLLTSVGMKISMWLQGGSDD